MIAPPVRVPTAATVVDEFPTIRLLMLARVATRELMNPLVVVELELEK